MLNTMMMNMIVCREIFFIFDISVQSTIQFSSGYVTVNSYLILILCFRPNVPRKSESLVNTVLVMVPHYVRW